MFQLLKAITAVEAFGRQLPLLIASLIIADQFYRFHSFIREAIAFLVTWFVLDVAGQGIVALRRRLIPLLPTEHRSSWVDS